MLFDAHFHIIDPQFPLIENKGFIPKPYTIEQYKQSLEKWPFVGGAIVAGSFQRGFQTYMLDALDKLGKNYVGVITLSPEMTDQQIMLLADKGVRAVRLNLFRGDKVDLPQIVLHAKRIYDLAGWHIELYLANESLKKLTSYIKQMPKVSIDHLGLTSEGLNDLYYLVEHGVYVKATGFMRTDFDVIPVMKKITGINPNALMFGTDLPGTRAKRQFNQDDLAIIKKNFSAFHCKRILYENALKFYRI